MCISDKDLSGGLSAYPDDLYLSVGEIYTVLYTCIGYGINDAEVPCYKLEEYKNSGKVFDQRNFQPLSDIDETEMIREEILQTS